MIFLRLIVKFIFKMPNHFCIHPFNFLYYVSIFLELGTRMEENIQVAVLYSLDYFLPLRSYVCLFKINLRVIVKLFFF